MESESDKTVPSAQSAPRSIQCPMCLTVLPASTTVCPMDGTILGVDTIFEQKYKILERLGAGGMGVIYLARHLLLDKLVAVKMLAAQAASDEDLRRFQIEAKAASLLEHVTIVRTRDFGTTASGQPYLVMDYIPGKTLSEVIKEKGGIEVSQFLTMSIAVCEGMAHAHKRGVLHRDLKPSNIMILGNGDGRDDYRILDFGIAKLFTDSESRTNNLTKTGETVGSPSYMSPEQVKGSKVDIRSDLYSLGCVMYEALVGIPPFSGNNAFQTMSAHLSEHAISIREASLGKVNEPALESIIFRLLEKDPTLRYQQMDDLKADLVSLQKVVSSSKRRAITFSSAAQKVESANPGAKKWPVVALGALTICGALGTAFYMKGQFPKSVSEKAPPADGSHIQQRTMAAQEGQAKKMGKDSIDEHLASIAASLSGTKSDGANDGNMPATKTDQNWLSKLVQTNPSEIDLRINGQLYEITDSDLKPLQDAIDAKTVILKNLNITDNGLEYLKNLSLEHLSLEGTKVKNLSALRKMKSLRWLDLSRTPVSGEGLKNLNTLTNLKKLELQNCRVKDSDLQPIESMKSLKTLNLTDCTQLSDAEVGKLRSRLKQCDVQFAIREQPEMKHLRKVEYLASLAQRNKDWSQAEKQYEQAVEILTEQVRADEQLVYDLQCLAHVRSAMKNFDGALQALSQALQVQYKRDDSDYHVPILLISMAETMEQKGNYGLAFSYRLQAKKQLARCVSQRVTDNPDVYSHRNLLGLCLDQIKLKELAGAVRDLTEAEKYGEDAESQEARVSVAEALSADHQDARALSLCDRIISFYETHPKERHSEGYREVMRKTASVLAKCKRQNVAEKLLKQLIDMPGGSQPARRNEIKQLVALLKEQRKVDEAIAYAKRLD